MAGSRPPMPAVSTRISGHSRNAHEGSREVERSHNLRGLRERAGLCEKLGVAQAAAADLAKVLELEPDASDGQQLRDRIRRLRGTSSGRLN